MMRALFSFLQQTANFYTQNGAQIGRQTLVHLGLTFFSLTLSILVSVPIGIWLSRQKRWAPAVIGFAGLLQTIPSIALLGLMIPVLGIGVKPAIFALFIYAILPIVRNTFTGIDQVSPSVKEAAMALGMTNFQRLWIVELPLALPVIMAGIQTATVINVGVATLAAYIGAGGLGEFIFGGISLNNSVMMVAGAAPVATLAILLDSIIGRLGRISSRSFPKMVTIVALCWITGMIFWSVGGQKPRLTAGLTPEFFGRNDGYQGLAKEYGLSLQHVIISDALMYSAIRQGSLDLVSGYSTDGRIQAYSLIRLVDDRHVFPPYQAAPLMRKETANAYPEVVQTVNLLAGRLNDSVMTSLNYQVDYLQKSPQSVAVAFLKKEGLFRPPQPIVGPRFTIGSKIFSEQYILSALYSNLLRGYTQLDIQTKTGLGGTQVCFAALQSKGIDMYPEYTGTGLMVILQPTDLTIKRLGPDPKKIYTYLTQEFEHKYRVSWLPPIGFNNAYTLLMRREQAKAIHVQTITQLTRYLRP